MKAQKNTVSFISPEHWSLMYFNTQTLNILKTLVSQPVLPDRTLFFLAYMPKGGVHICI